MTLNNITTLKNFLHGLQSVSTGLVVLPPFFQLHRHNYCMLSVEAVMQFINYRSLNIKC